MLIALVYYLATLVGQLSSVLTRHFEPLPERFTGKAISAR
jgi:hypothetical protein